MSTSDFSKISDAMESYFAKGQLERKRIKYKAGCFVTLFFYTYGQYLGQGTVERPIKATETASSSYEHRNVFSVLKKPK